MSANTIVPDLSSLASNAAVELDLLILGEPNGLQSVKALAARLNEAVQGVNGYESSGKRLAIDTVTETILGHAFHETGDDPKALFDRLFERTKEAAQQLGSADRDSDPKSLEWQRAFCLALSRFAATYQQMILNARPKHPYRR